MELCLYIIISAEQQKQIFALTKKCCYLTIFFYPCCWRLDTCSGTFGVLAVVNEHPKKLKS